MAPEPRLALALVLAGVTALLLTPVAVRAAGRFDFFDRPRGYRGHARPIPYLGGSAVLGAFLVAVLVVAGDPGRTLPLLAGALVLWAIGTVDDRRHVAPALRAGAEVAVALALWTADLGWDLGAGGALDAALTVLWVLAVVNAFNLFDNMDGATGTMAAVVGGAVAVLGLRQDDAWLVAAGAALTGSCLGFLPFNLARPQARIFLGDGGSMPVGLVAATLVMSGASGLTHGLGAVATGALLVAVPAVDMSLVIVSRRRKGISVLTGGRDHLTHRARRRLGSARSVALVLGGLQVVVAAAAIAAQAAGAGALAAVAVAVVALGAGAVFVLEREEDRLLADGSVTVPQEALDRAAARRAGSSRPSLGLGDAVLAALVAGAALSPLAFGFYDPEAWVPIGLAVLLAAAVGAIRRPQRMPAAAWLVLVGFVGIGLVALLSSGWAAAPGQAVDSADRWLVLAAIAALALVLVRSTLRSLIAVVGLAAGTAVIAAIVLVRMLGSHGSDLFLGGRLHEPLGYINAEATVFIMGVWLCLAAAERREAWLAGLGMGGATAMAGLTLLSQSRGAALAALLSIVVVVAVVPGRRRRVFALALVAAGLAAASGPVLHVYDASLLADGVPPEGVIRRAAATILITAVVAGTVWAVCAGLLARAAEPTRARAAGIARLVIAAGVLVALVLGVATSGRIADRVGAQWTAFTEVGAAGQANAPTADAGSRLASGAGNRYDYWRVAWDAFGREPLHGIGAGNFDRAWYAGRSVPEDIRQPHSIELQVLSELGLAGGVFLVLVLAGLVLGVVRGHAAARRPGTARTLAVAAVGVPVAWLIQTSADWIHLIPGTTAVALVMLAVLVRGPFGVTPAERAASAGDEASAGLQGESAADATASLRAARPRPRPGALAGFATLAVVVAITGAVLTRQLVADHFRAAAFEQVATAPRAAVADADRSLDVDPQAIRTFYAKAAALARLGRGADAAAVLRSAAERDPTNPVTWALRGDLATRRGQTAAATRFYARALALNPLDPGLQTLAAGR